MAAVSGNVQHEVSVCLKYEVGNALLTGVGCPKSINRRRTVNDEIVVNLHFCIVFTIRAGEPFTFAQHFINSERALCLRYGNADLLSWHHHMSLAVLSVSLPDTSPVLTWHGDANTA